MHTEGFHELDAVRVTQAIQDKDAYTLDPAAVPAGATGTIVVGEPGRESYDVEFLLTRPNGGTYSAVLVVDAALLEPLQ